MKWLFRPSVLIGVSAALVAAAAFVYLSEAPLTRPVPQPVGKHDTEVVWLYPATAAGSWERFVDGVRRAVGRLQPVFPGLSLDEAAAFPGHTRAPEVALSWPAARGRLIFRWYKLTSNWGAGPWIDALLRRSPPPVAVIGGGSSYWARELALQLQTAGTASALPENARPLLLLTTATADRVQSAEGAAEADAQSPRVPLHRLYSGRTFRFCFTNRQMATAITRFIWTRDDLRPEGRAAGGDQHREPIYMVQWEDDAYSQDLIEGYGRVFPFRLTETVAHQWGALTGYAAQGLFPPAALALAVRDGTNFRLDGGIQRSESSVGGFASPNAYEANAVQLLLNQIQEAGLPPQRRPLLVVSGQSQPSRRLLRDLARSAPAVAHRFVVATGDAISFNTIYRDRAVTWPIQDLPFKLVLFCHRNPVDPQADFRPCPDVRPGPGRDEESGPGGDAPGAATGTDDLLLNREIVEALAQAFLKDGRRAADASELGRRLKELRWRAPDSVGYEKGTHLFHDAGQAALGVHGAGQTLVAVSAALGFLRPGPASWDVLAAAAAADARTNTDGQRVAGTGEHVVYLRPLFRGEQVLPQSEIEVWAWEFAEGSRRVWLRRGEPLEVSYDETLK